jgi:hypothetical protein
MAEGDGRRKAGEQRCTEQQSASLIVKCNAGRYITQESIDIIEEK